MNATLEHTVFIEFQKGRTLKKAFLRLLPECKWSGVSKKLFFQHVRCARPRALSVPLCHSLTHIECCSFAFAPFLLHATCDVKNSSQKGLKILVHPAECARPRALSLLK